MMNYNSTSFSPVTSSESYNNLLFLVTIPTILTLSKGIPKKAVILSTNLVSAVSSPKNSSSVKEILALIYTWLTYLTSTKQEGTLVTTK